MDATFSELIGNDFEVVPGFMLGCLPQGDHVEVLTHLNVATKIAFGKA
jgi:hypothetical protein